MNYIELHKKTWAALQGRRDRLPHALLLSGQPGLGKFEVAQAFAKSLLCESPRTDQMACGQCLACNWFAQGNHPDYRLLQPDALSEVADSDEGTKKASHQITIDQVRGLDDFLSVGTHRAGLRIIVVNPAEAMNRNTANSLLKSLEEPAPDTLFLLVSSEPLRLLPTIRSRCQLVPVATPGNAMASAALKAENISDPERWLALAGGSPRLARQFATSGQSSWLDMLTKQLAQAKNVDALAFAADFDKQIKESKGKLTLKQIVDALQKWLVDVTFAQHNLPVRYFLQQRDTINTLADMIPAIRLLHAYRALNARRRESEQPMNPRLFLETLFLDYRALFATTTP